MKRDNAPVPYTCPVIDEIISAIDSVEWEETSWHKEYLLEKMEYIRSANSSLREWGNERQDAYDKLENKIDELMYEIESLSEKINELTSDIE